MKFFRKIFQCLFLVFVVFGIQNLEAAIIQSTFDFSDEGWTVHEVGAANLYWSTSGGNPGGFIYSEDMAVTNMYISAPTKFLGNLLPFDGGIFSFDAIELENTREPWFKFGVVEFYNGSDYIQKDLSPDPDVDHPVPLPMTWTTYSTILSADEWGVSMTDFEDILSNVTELRIYLESGWWVGAETVGVDNITLNSVPIPGAIWLFGAGLLGMLVTKHKLRK